MSLLLVAQVQKSPGIHHCRQCGALAAPKKKFLCFYFVTSTYIIIAGYDSDTTLQLCHTFRTYQTTRSAGRGSGVPGTRIISAENGSKSVGGAVFLSPVRAVPRSCPGPLRRRPSNPIFMRLAQDGRLRAKDTSKPLRCTPMPTCRDSSPLVLRTILSRTARLPGHDAVRGGELQLVPVDVGLTVSVADGAARGA